MIKVIVPVSGGKDSQACLKLALEAYPKDEVIGLFCDTQFEHPLTYAHIKNMRKIYGVTIERISAGSVPSVILSLTTPKFPNGVMRFCTDRLKIVPSKKYYKKLAEEQQNGFEVWLGMRLAESNARTKRFIDKVNTDRYAPHDVIGNYPKYLQKLGVWFRLPVLDWSTSDVMDFLAGEENPLYRQGFDRVGCFPCLASGDKWKKKAFTHDSFGREQRVIVAALENVVGDSIFTNKIQRNSEKQGELFEGCSICAM